MQRNRKKYINKKAVLSFILCVILLTAGIPVKTARAASLKIYYPAKNQTVTYAKKQISYRYDDVILDLDGAVGLLTDNEVAIGPYYEIFVKALGVSYHKEGEKLTLTRGKNTITLTVGSKTAILNGVRKQMSAAPVSVRFPNTNVTRIMVPTRFVAEALGFAYRWDSSTSTVIIQDRMTLSCNGKQISYIGAAGKINVDGKKMDVSVPVLQLKNTEMIEAYRIFSKELDVDYFYDRTTGEIRLQRENIVLQMQEGSTIAWINGVMLDCGVAPVCMKNHENSVERLLVPGQFVAENLGYGYQWDSTVKTAYITTLDLADLEEEEEEPIKYSFVLEKELTDKLSNSDPVVEEEFDSTIMSDQEEGIESDSMEISGREEGMDSDSMEISDKEEGMDSDSTEISDKEEGTESDSTEIPDKEEGMESDSTEISDKAEDMESDSTEISDKAEDMESDSTEIPDKEEGMDSDSTEISDEEDDTESDETVPEQNYLLELERGTNENGSYFCFRSLFPLNDYELFEESEDWDVIYFNHIGNSLEEDEFPEILFEEYFDCAVFLREEDAVSFSYQLAEGISFYPVEEEDGLYLYFEDFRKNEKERKEPEAAFIPLPEGVSFSTIKTEDQYWDKKIVFTIPGKWKSYYKENPIVNEYPVVQAISIKEKNGNTEIVFLTARIQGYTAKKKKGGFVVRIGEPSKIYDKIVVLDAGHGGNDPGATVSGYREKDINFNILYHYAKAYFDQSDIKVYYSRRTDTKVDLYERADFASQVEADLFISLHMNANNSTAVRGTSVYYSKMNTSINRGGLDSESMATLLAKKLSGAMGTKNRGVYAEDFVVVRMTRMPSVLIELAFLTNANDRHILTDKSKQKIAAKTIFDTVTSFFKQYPTGR